VLLSLCFGVSLHDIRMYAHFVAAFVHKLVRDFIRVASIEVVVDVAAPLSRSESPFQKHGAVGWAGDPVNQPLTAVTHLVQQRVPQP